MIQLIWIQFWWIESIREFESIRTSLETTNENTPLNVKKEAVAEINDHATIRAAVPHDRRLKKTDA